MKIIITATQDSLQAKVDPRFGRATFFCCYDMENNTAEFIPNEQALDSPAGAGIQAARTAASTGAQILITGHVGPKAFKALSAVNMTIYFCQSNTVANAINDYKNGKLEKADQADVEGHW